MTSSTLKNGVFRRWAALLLSLTSLNYADTWVLHCSKIFVTVWSSAVNLNQDEVMEKQTKPVLCSGFECICCVILQGMVTSDMPLCRQMFSCTSKEDVQSRMRTGKIRVNQRKSGGASDTFTPSCQFCLWASHAALSCSLAPSSPPLSVLVFGFQTVKSKQDQDMSLGMKEGEGRKMKLRGKPGGGNVEPSGEIWSDRRWMAWQQHCVIYQNLSDVSWLSKIPKQGIVQNTTQMFEKSGR